MSDEFSHLQFQDADDHQVHRFRGRVSTIKVTFGELTLSHAPWDFWPGEPLLNGWKFALPHQCDEWVINDPVKMRVDLDRAVKWAQSNSLTHGPCGECGKQPDVPEHHWRHVDYHRYTREGT